MDRRTVADLVVAARGGDQHAWDEIVSRFSGMVWSVVRGYRLEHATASDVFQTTWLRLVEHLDDLREPAAVGGWLATTARRECLRVLRREGRVLATDDGDLEVIAADEPELGAGVFADERDRTLWAAFEELQDRCRRLLRLLMADPAPSYEDVSAALEMPIGSIGPTRARCLDRLRDHLEARGIRADSGVSW